LGIGDAAPEPASVGDCDLLSQSPPRVSADVALLDALAVALRGARRPLCVVGPAPFAHAAQRQAVLDLLRIARLPVYADAASQLRFLPHGERAEVEWLDAMGAALAVPASASPALWRLEPDLILQLGAAPVATAWEAFVESRRDCRHVVIAEHDRPDPVSTAECVVQAPLPAVCAELAARLAVAPEKAPEDGEDLEAAAAWRSQLAVCGKSWLGAVRATLRHQSVADVADSVDGADTDGADTDGADTDRADTDNADIADEGIFDAPPLAEAVAVRAVIEEMPHGGVLMVGNSLPVRFLDVFSAGVEEVWQPGAGRLVRVLSQRGVNGIDGLVSGAAGAASVATMLDGIGHGGAPFCLLLGDVALLHDLGGLAALRHRLPGPFIIVVIHNGGGRIFEQLPVWRLATARGISEHWTTPHDLAFRGVAEMFGLHYERVGDVGALRGGLRRAFAERIPGGGASDPSGTGAPSEYDDHGAVLIEVTVAPDSARRGLARLAQELSRLARGEAASETLSSGDAARSLVG
jgi:2-succinyl-5-enolpyruvyl-6-hydroxy-3-cyclohexene-1-carboxylate synthase